MKKRTALSWMVMALVLASITATALAAPQAASTAKKSTSPSTHSSTGSRSSGSLLNPASLKLQAPAVFDAKFTTTKGDFVVEATRAWSPRGADRFYNLVKYHFFDGAPFFRVLPGFVVQFGISPRPEVSRVWEQAKITDDPVTQNNTRGMLSFATAGPSTRTTQIFINLGNNPNLDGMGFSPFGKVVSGMDVVDNLYSGYGEGAPNGSGPDQERLQKEGKAYFQKAFSLLDIIKSAVVVPAASVAATKPAAAQSKPASVQH